MISLYLTVASTPFSIVNVVVIALRHLEIGNDILGQKDEDIIPFPHVEKLLEEQNIHAFVVWL